MLFSIIPNLKCRLFEIRRFHSSLLHCSFELIRVGCFDFDPEFVSSFCCQLVSASSCSCELAQFVKNSLRSTFFRGFSLRIFSCELRLYGLSFTVRFPKSEAALILLLPTLSRFSPCPEGLTWFRVQWSDGFLSEIYLCRYFPLSYLSYRMPGLSLFLESKPLWACCCQHFLHCFLFRRTDSVWPNYYRMD